MTATLKFVPGLNRQVKFRNRDELRLKSHKFHLNLHALLGVRAGLTQPPTGAFNWSKNHTLSFPIDYNDKDGDCFYASACHCSNAQTGNVGTQDFFDPNAILSRYLFVSGGDNGLAADQIFGEWKNHGLANTNHKILDFMPVNPRDAAAMRAGIWYFGGAQFTLAIPDAWLGDIRAGMLWDAGNGVVANMENGHATYIDGISRSGHYDVETWALNPPVSITPGGVAVCEPEAFVVFSLDWFNASGVSPNGMHYDDLSVLWTQLGGAKLPPFPGSAPPPPPPPNNAAAQIDALFAKLEASLRGYPRLLAMVTTLQHEVDAVLATMSLSRAQRALTVGNLSPAQLKQLADAICNTLRVIFATNPTVVSVIAQLQTILDLVLTSLGG